MIKWIDRLLVSWAEHQRVGAGGFGFASVGGMQSLALSNPSRVRRRLSRQERRALEIRQAGLSGGCTAHAVATRRQGGAPSVVMRGDVERVDRFITSSLSRRAQRVLFMFYVEQTLTMCERLTRLEMSESRMYELLDEVHIEIDRHLRPAAHAEREMDRLSEQVERLLA